MNRQYVRKPASWIKRGPNVRSFLGDEAELIALGRSLVKHQQQPFICSSDGTARDGARRLEALRLIGRLDLEVDIIITDEPLDDAARARFQLISAVHRRGLPLSDKCEAIQVMVASNPRITNKQLADELDVDPSLVTKLRSYEGLIDAAKQAVKDGKLDIIKMYSIGQLPAEEQPALLAVASGKASREEVANRSRKARNGGAPAVRTSKIKCPLPSGHVITVAGDELSLDEAIDSLKEAIKAMTKARDTGLDAKTAQAVWRDMAKAG